MYIDYENDSHVSAWCKGLRHRSPVNVWKTSARPLGGRQEGLVDNRH